MTYQTSYPMSQPTQPQQPPRPRGNLLLGILLGVIVGAIIGVLAWFALIDDPDSATPAPAQSPTAVESVEPSVEPSPEASPDPSASPTEDPAEPEEPASPEPSPEPTEGDNPEIVTELPASWVTVLASLPKNSTSADQAIALAQELTPSGRTTIVLDSNAFAGLTPGYWVVVIPGSSSGDEALAVCTAIGLQPKGNSCYARQIQG